MQLFIGNKNYSSWSMRPWVLMRHFDIPFEEVKLRFDSFAASSQFKQAISMVSPTGKVPALRHNIDGRKLVVWDTLAIAEYLAETYPEEHLWPQNPFARAQARSVCAEMHSGFGALRSHCGMNIEADLRTTGAHIWTEHEAVRHDVGRLQAMWGQMLQEYGGTYLFGDFSIADAYFAPVCTRIATYGLPVDAACMAYVERILATPAVAQWMSEARAEEDFLGFEEPYRKGR